MDDDAVDAARERRGRGARPTLRYEEVRCRWPAWMSAAGRGRLGSGARRRAVSRSLQGAELVGLEFETFFPDLPGATVGVRHVVIPWDYLLIRRKAPGSSTSRPAAAPRTTSSASEHVIGRHHADRPGQGNNTSIYGLFRLAFRRSQRGPGVGRARSLKELGLHVADRVIRDELYPHSVPVVLALQEATCSSASCTTGSSASRGCASSGRRNQKVEWEPPHNGNRMDDWLRNMGDWSISRKRYLGLPLPFYPCECGQLNVVGSRRSSRSARSARRPAP